MTDQGLKNLLGFALRHKEQISELLNRFYPEDVENGILALPQDLIRRDLKMIIMEKGDPYLQDYDIQFSGNSICLTLSAEIKQLGPIKAVYLLTVADFTFNSLVRSITLTFREDVKSNGTMLQNMALKAASLKGPYLQTAVELSHVPFVSVNGDNITVDLSKIEGIKKIPPELTLNYVSSEDGILKFKFRIAAELPK